MIRTTLLSLSAGAAALALTPAAEAKTNVDVNIGLGFGFEGGYVPVGDAGYYDEDDYVVGGDGIPCA